MSSNGNNGNDSPQNGDEPTPGTPGRPPRHQEVSTPIPSSQDEGFVCYNELEFHILHNIDNGLAPTTPLIPPTPRSLG